MEEKYFNWQEAFGLAELDGLEPSLTLQSLAESNIIGQITFKEAEKLLLEYYHNEENNPQYIQDTVMLRIAIILSTQEFQLSKEYFRAIHKYLFAKTSFNPGEYRTINVTKKEPILNGYSVIYSPASMIDENLSYDFAEARKKRIITNNPEQAIQQIMPFISNIWQSHPFKDGNTRTTSVFLEQYLKKLGFQTNNSIFKENSTYFRNALVRNNYETSRTLEPTSEFLYKFFYKVLIDPTVILDPEEQKVSITRK